VKAVSSATFKLTPAPNSMTGDRGSFGGRVLHIGIG
jgi:hypothetical protein